MNQKLNFPATARNANPILQVLQDHLPTGNVIEIAAGSGQHVVYFAKHFPRNTFWPTDLDPLHIQSIAQWRSEANLANIKPAFALDTTDPNWLQGQPIAALPNKAAAILCMNMIHIAPITAAQGLFSGAALRLRSGGLLYLYGPFLGAADQDAPSNLEFDLDLKRRNPNWGVRQLTQIKQMAKTAGFQFEQALAMPANNFSVLFRRQ